MDGKNREWTENILNSMIQSMDLEAKIVSPSFHAFTIQICLDLNVEKHKKKEREKKRCKAKLKLLFGINTPDSYVYIFSINITNRQSLGVYLNLCLYVLILML